MGLILRLFATTYRHTVQIGKQPITESRESMPRQACKRNQQHVETLFRALVFTLVLPFVAAGTLLGIQQAGGVPASGPSVKMVRSVAGTKGDPRGGSFVMADPRTTFFVPDDRQVIVYFEWEAPRGTHHCEGTLRGPKGQLSVMSSFDYPATQTRFGGFWTVPLLENTTAGVWTFESHVDGEPAGTLSFEIVSAKRPADTMKEEAPPTPAEIYARAVAASVLVERVDAKGQPFDGGSGFFLENGLLVTAFRAIDGAHALRIRLSDGRYLQSDAVVAWNRRQDWVILKVDAGKGSVLRKASDQSVTVGDHCYWLDAKTDGGRVISEGQIVGKESHEGWGERFSISGPFNSTAMGGPVLNEQGGVVGLLGGALPEIQRRSAGSTFTMTGSVVPIGLVNAISNATPTPLQTLWTTNQFTVPLTAVRNISFGMITQGKPQKRKGLLPKEMKVDFTPHDGSAAVVVAFQGIDAWKNTVQLRIYDVDNRLLTRGDPVKISLRSGETQERIWNFPLAMQPGIYRADVFVGEEVAWREYFQIRE
jgi:S1-C subfamily serine protease